MCGEEEGLPGGAGGKEPIANAGEWRDLGLIPGWGRSPGGGHGNPLQYSCLENPIDRGAWQGTVHGVAKSDTPEWPNTHARRGGAWPEDQSPLGADMEVEGPGACAEGGGLSQAPWGLHGAGPPDLSGKGQDHVCGGERDGACAQGRGMNWPYSKIILDYYLMTTLIRFLWNCHIQQYRLFIMLNRDIKWRRPYQNCCLQREIVWRFTVPQNKRNSEEK